MTWICPYCDEVIEEQDIEWHKENCSEKEEAQQ